MKTILIVYHSQTGNTLKMAHEVAKGASSIENVTVVFKTASEATLADLLQCDGLVIGSPEYFGYMSGMIKDFFDRTYSGALGSREIFRKPYALFISAGNDGRGAVAAVERICMGYPLKKIHDPVIARGEISRAVLDRCSELGQTIAAGCDAGIY